MKRVLTKIIVHWEGFTVCEDEDITEEILEKDKEELKHYITKELSLDHEDITKLDINIEVEIEHI